MSDLFTILVLAYLIANFSSMGEIYIPFVNIYNTMGGHRLNQAQRSLRRRTPHVLWVGSITAIVVMISLRIVTLWYLLPAAGVFGLLFKTYNAWKWYLGGKSAFNEEEIGFGKLLLRHLNITD